MARPSLLGLSAVAVAVGVLSGGVVLLFRWSIESSQLLFLSDHVGNYEALPPAWRLSLPLAGGILLGLVFERIREPTRRVGVGHVLSALHTPAGERLPIGNALAQFFGGIWSIVTGHSVDREGPGVHLGAAAGSLLGQRMGLVSEYNYTLTTSGAAAAISAAFDTPLAGVVFVIEVLGVRYSVSRFLPVILAAVSAAVLSRALYGSDPAFAVPPVTLATLLELPSLALLGLIVGLLAAAFIALVRWVTRATSAWGPRLAFSAAGALTGCLALWVPQIMGVSYDSLEAILEGRIELMTLLGICMAKLVATGVSVGLRVPGGLIGPMLVVGGATGGALGAALAGWVPASEAGLAATIGMVAMMGATLHAPLAALTALLELTANPNILLPGMLAVAGADLVVRRLQGPESVFGWLDADDEPQERT